VRSPLAGVACGRERGLSTTVLIVSPRLSSLPVMASVAREYNKQTKKQKNSISFCCVRGRTNEQTNEQEQ
jgi:hypothetical protein